MEEKLARIPFSREEEQTIQSMARWMRFMAVVGIVVGFLMLFILVLGVGLFSAAQGLGESSPETAKLRQVMAEAGPILYFLLAVVLLAVVASLWQDFMLYYASDSFDLVARTDTADLDYLTRGMDQLRVFFKIQVMLMLITAAVAVGGALTVVALTTRIQ